jgi:hypothetical protein
MNLYPMKSDRFKNSALLVLAVAVVAGCAPQLAVVWPGTTLIITDVHVGRQTRSGSAFNILTTD